MPPIALHMCSQLLCASSPNGFSHARLIALRMPHLHEPSSCGRHSFAHAHCASHCLAHARPIGFRMRRLLYRHVHNSQTCRTEGGPAAVMIGLMDSPTVRQHNHCPRRSICLKYEWPKQSSSSTRVSSVMSLKHYLASEWRKSVDNDVTWVLG